VTVDPNTWYAVSVVFMYLIAIPANGFPIIYGTFFPWFKSWLGRALFTKAIGIALLVDTAVLYQLLGDDYPGRGLIRFIAFGTVLIGIYLQFFVVVYLKLNSLRPDEENLK
jgi:hypothetical protein